MQGRARALMRLAVSFGVSGGLVAWLVWAIEWPAVWSALHTVHYGYLLPATVVLVAHFLLRALRWRYLLPPPIRSEDVGLRRLFDSILVGAFATFVLPLRAGEFVRPLLLARTTTYSFGAAFASVVIERFFDLAMVLVCFGLMLRFVIGLPPWVEYGAGTLTVLAGGLSLFLVLGSLVPGKVRLVMGVCLRPLPRGLSEPLGGFVDGLLSATAVLRSPWRLGAIMGLTVLVWVSSFAVSGICLWLFDIPASVPFVVAIGVIIALAVAAPSAPGFIGVFQTACVAAFALFGFSREEAIAYSLIAHAHQFVIFVGYGVWLMFKYNLSLADLRRAPPSEPVTK